jgi:Flp pilus assembly protein TadB
LDWLLLVGLGIMWVAFLLPTDRRRHSAKASVEDFERRMELLAQTEAQDGPGRWIMTPRKEARFVGPVERQRARARERRRRVFVFLLESIGLTFLIGAVPPLRAVWIFTGVLLALLTVYVWLLVTLTHRAPPRPHERVAAAREPRPSARARVAAAAQRYVAEGHSTWARPTFNGLGSLGEGDTVHVVVRAAGDVGVARA